MTEAGTIRLIVSDIDGTLIDRTKEVPSFSRDQLRRVRRDFGVDCVLASSRMPSSIEVVRRAIGANKSMVAYDGALVLDQDGTVLSEEALDAEALQGLLRVVQTADVFVALYSGDEWAVEEVGYWALREIRGTKIWPRVGPLESTLRAWLATEQSIHKVMIRGKAEEVDRVCAQATTAISLGEMSRTRDTLVEFRAPSADKALGVKLLLARAHIDPQQVVAFGDGVNDLKLLEMVGCGVAVSNAQDQVLKAADQVTLSNEEDGVGYWLLSHFRN